MIIDRKLEKYIVFTEDAIRLGLKKMDVNNMRVIFVVGETGILEGIITDGDFRRWAIQHDTIDLEEPVSKVANKHFQYCHIGEQAEIIAGLFSSRIDNVPLVNDTMHLIAVASQRKPNITINNRSIAESEKVFIIAEIGNNHNGNLDLAKKLVDEAVNAGADCVKFQVRNMKDLYSNEGDANDSGEDLGSQYVLDLLNKFQLSNEELVTIFDYCKEQHIISLCTPWDSSSVDFLDDYGMEGFKIASADFTNHDLLKAIVAKGKPMFCSTGMTTEQEIKSGVRLLRRLGAQFVLLHCNSTYPAPFKDVNLNYLETLRELSDSVVGYSGHERGIHVVIAAVAMGAKVIEKHLTLDRNMEGNDHKVSLLPNEFKLMVQGIREVEQALGTDQARTITQGELINRESLAKSLVINRDLAKGEIVSKEMIEIKSPGKGLPPYLLDELAGTVAIRDFAKGDFFYSGDLKGEQIEPRDYHFIHPFGVPVRYHDALTISQACKMDLLEIHLSYKDLEQDIERFFTHPFTQKLVVHSPELFAGDHVLDLCSTNQSYRARSIVELQNVIEITNDLKKFFPKSAKPLIVVNVGGFSSDTFVSQEERHNLYEILTDSLSQINQSGVELIPQTMPPFPWHFGGQRFHNLFVDIDEILEFCLKQECRVCLDVSHSKLACNYYNSSFIHFLEKVAPITAHLHIADAKGIDGEGLQIWDGEIDFILLMETLRELMPGVSFIPEIWQGHKNDGQGFWVALDSLEKAIINAE